MKNKIICIDQKYFIEISSKTYGILHVAIDKEDIDLIQEFKWHISRNKTRAEGRQFTAATRLPTGKVFYIYNHILKERSINQEIDHIDGDPLNNRRCNLRAVTHQENVWNRVNAKGYRYYSSRKKWRAFIGLNNKLKHLGYFETEKEAREAYLKAKASLHTTKKEEMTMRNFTRKEDLDVLMREFQEHQSVFQAAEDDQKKKYEAYQRASEYRALCEEYRKLFSKMLKEMLNITKPADADKIRLNYSQKLAPVLQKLRGFTSVESDILEVTTPTATLQSRESVKEGLEKITKLVGAAEALKAAVLKTEGDVPQSS